MSEKEEEKEGFDFDFGSGKIGLGGIFKGIEKLVDLSSKLEESGGEIKQEGEFDLSQLKKGMKGVYGFSIRSSLGGKGKPVVESFGNIKKTPKGPKVEEEREPITDVFDEEGEIRIYAEMPGVTEAGIKLDLKEDILDISAQDGDRKYHKEILLPVQVKPETLSSNYKNGILEVMVKKG
ncbi:MAG: archaeal heat shock protein Hsp20 [Candidatus Euphemobacter frigidus]|nr:archaeal heat shock protein Hsp20 [Candidatus Euphemobacter frigidus]